MLVAPILSAKDGTEKARWVQRVKKRVLDGPHSGLLRSSMKYVT